MCWNLRGIAFAYSFLYDAARSDDLYYLTDNALPTISNCSIPIFLLPGNHHRFVDHDGKAGGLEFDKVFSELWGDPNPVVKQKVLYDPSTKAVLGFIALDCCLRCDEDADPPVGINRYGQGIVHSLDVLTSKTKELRAKYPSAGIVWVLHFPPVSAAYIDNTASKLKEAEGLMKEAKRLNIKLILSGHIHKNRWFREEEIDVCCAGSACAFMCGDDLWVHKLLVRVQNSTAMLAKRQDYQWSKNKKDFELVETIFPSGSR